MHTLLDNNTCMSESAKDSHTRVQPLRGLIENRRETEHWTGYSFVGKEDLVSRERLSMN